MRFDDYPFSDRLKGNLKALGFKRPTDIQFRAIPPVLNGQDLLAVAHTGTGKTLAYLLPLLHRLERSDFHRTLAVKEHNESLREESAGLVGSATSERVPSSPSLVMVPTHELAAQVAGVARALAHGMRLSIICITGGGPVQEQAERIPDEPDLVIGTPGRLHDLARNQNLSFRDLRYLVLDEADKMLSLGFKDDIDRLLQFMPRNRQTLFLSATISPTIKRLAYRLVVNPIRIEIAPENPVARTVQHALIEVPQDQKRFYLERIIRERAGQRIIVFTRTRLRAERVTAAMERAGIEALTMHGDRDREQRREALQNFANGTPPLLITTDVAARGLDIPDIALVINYDLPTQPEVYVHRIGRTGRAKQRGQALSFCAPEEENSRRAIERFLGYLLPIVELSEQERLDTIDYSKASRADWKELIKRHHEYEEAAKKAKAKRAKRKIKKRTQR